MEPLSLCVNRRCGLVGQSTCLVNRRSWVQIPAVPQKTAIPYQQWDFGTWYFSWLHFLLQPHWQDVIFDTTQTHRNNVGHPFLLRCFHLQQNRGMSELRHLTTVWFFRPLGFGLLVRKHNWALGNCSTTWWSRSTIIWTVTTKCHGAVA